MDPIDFTRPEAFGEAGASSAAESDLQDPKAMQRLRRALWSLLRWSLSALLLWAIGAALLATALQQAQPDSSALEWPLFHER